MADRGEHWATVELTDRERIDLEAGEMVEHVIERRERSMEVLEMHWRSKGVTSPLYTLDDVWPRLADGPEVRIGEKPLEAVYQDRNLLACALVQASQTPSGWTPDPERPAEWAIAWLETPYGQVSWHVPREMAERLNLSRDDSYEWDGHDRERKNDVLASWTQDGCPS